jgi:hypothetical protein
MSGGGYMLRINSDTLQALTGLDTINPAELLLICKIIASDLNGRSKADKINIEKLQNILKSIEVK